MEQEIIAKRAAGVVSLYVVSLVVGLILAAVGVGFMVSEGESGIMWWIAVAIGGAFALWSVFVIVRYLCVPETVHTLEGETFLFRGRRIPIADIARIDYRRARVRHTVYPWGRFFFYLKDGTALSCNYVEDVRELFARLNDIIESHGGPRSAE